MNTKKIIKNLKNILEKDKDYYYGWQSNIAMAFYDEFIRNGIEMNKDILHTISNQAAKNFLNLLMK